MSCVANCVDATLIERLKANADKCALRSYLLDRAKGKVALLHKDDHDNGYLGVKLSDDEVHCLPTRTARTFLAVPNARIGRGMLQSDEMLRWAADQLRRGVAQPAGARLDVQLVCRAPGT